MMIRTVKDSGINNYLRRLIRIENKTVYIILLWLSYLVFHLKESHPIDREFLKSHVLCRFCKKSQRNKQGIVHYTIENLFGS